MREVNSFDAGTEMRRHMERTQEISEQLLAPIAKRAREIRRAMYEREASQVYQAWLRRKGNAHPCVYVDTGEELSAAYIFCDHNKSALKNSIFLPEHQVSAFRIERRLCIGNQQIPDISIRPSGVHQSVFRRTKNMAANILSSGLRLMRQIIRPLNQTRKISSGQSKKSNGKKQEKRKESL